MLQSPLFILRLAAAAAGTLTVCASDFYVAPGGNDGGDGAKDRPLATLEAARDAARKAGAGPHRIVLTPGDYYLEKTLKLNAKDSGLTIEAATNGVVLYGGKPVTGWRRDGENFWTADLPGVKEGAWDFRALVVNGRMPARARMPATETFTHQSAFDVKWLSSVGGGWERKPTKEELTTLAYSPADLPATLDARNAEVRVYHMWDDSLVGVASNDVARHTLHFSTPSGHPAGAFGVKKYVVFNTREGMTQPGQWYLDRSAGRLVYWPLPGEDMAKAKVVAPTLERVIDVTGSAKEPAARIALRGFSVQATTTPLKPGGFSAGEYDAAIHLTDVGDCEIQGVEICNVGGQAVKSWKLNRCRIADCHIHHVGACGIRTGGDDCAIANNHIHHVGVYQPSAVALQFGHTYSEAKPKGFHIFRNEIHDTPYCGMTAGGGGHLIEENLIYRVMRELHDGAAIYGMLTHSVLRGNIVRDVVEVGKGYGASAYYLDEGSADCVIERNIAIGVPMPTHNHITSRLTVRNNVFVSDTDLKISFPRSRDTTFEGNTLYAPGKITVSPPNAVTSWVGNVLFAGNADKEAAPSSFSIGDVLPPSPPPKRQAGTVFPARLPAPPAIDGETGDGEWPIGSHNIDCAPSRWPASGAPAFAKIASDGQCLYVALNVVLFDINKLRKGHVWGTDDGAEICIAGKDGTFVLRGFADGTSVSATDAGVPAEAAERVGKAVRFAAKPYGKAGDWHSGWHAEWAIPFDALGIQAVSGKKVGFNLGLYRAEDRVWRCLEGTLSENWKLDQAGSLQIDKAK